MHWPHWRCLGTAKYRGTSLLSRKGTQAGFGANVRDLGRTIEAEVFLHLSLACCDPAYIPNAASTTSNQWSRAYFEEIPQGC